jgi:NADH-quinone oxidoreductase subunit I
MKQVTATPTTWSQKLLLLDLFEGLKTTLRELFKKKVTIEYPEQRMEPTDRFRGMFRFNYDRCIACKLCAIACPIDIIYIDVHDETIEQDGKKKKVKVLDRYDIDVKRCMFCGLCEEACPTDPKSIWLTTKTYELAAYDRGELYFNMQELEYWENRPEYKTLEESAEEAGIADDESDQPKTLSIAGGEAE